MTAFGLKAPFLRPFPKIPQENVKNQKRAASK